MRVLLWIVMSVFMLAQFAAATVRTVSPNPGSAAHQTLISAYTAAVNGDTIVVGPGTYSEQIISSKRLNWIGSGWDVCSWGHPGGASLINGGGSAGTTVEGFRLSPGTVPINDGSGTDSISVRRCYLISPGSACINHDNGKLTVEDCILQNTIATSNIVINGVATGNVVLRNTVFTVNVTSGTAFAINGVNGGVIEIYNCVFANHRNPFNIDGVPQVIGLNNIFVDFGAGAGWGDLPVGSVFEYTGRDNTGPAFTAMFSNNIDLGANNPFVTYAPASNYVFGTTDLHLNGGAGGLACTNTGYPSILDLDGSRSDLGIYGGPKPLVDLGLAAYPFAITLTIDNLVEIGDSVSVSSTGRIGPRY